MIKRQSVFIISLLVLFAVMLVAYLVVVRPLTAKDDETDAPPPETNEGEGLTYGDYFLMFPQVERKNIQSIEVHNEYGEYKFVRTGEAESDFAIEGHENLAYDEELFSQLVVSAGYSMAPQKVTEKPTEQELIDYGFAGKDVEPAYYILTTTSGQKHKVTIGKKIISGGAYYAMYEGRDTVYIIDVGAENTLLQPVEALLSPLLTAGIETTSYYLINNFTIKHKGEDFLVCRNLTTEELGEMETTAIAKSIAVFPAEYNLSMMYDTTLQALCYYSGESVAAMGLTAENLEKFGLSTPAYTVSYEYGGAKITLNISEKTDDGYYYASTSLFRIIVKVPAADFEFLEWGLMNWIDEAIFSRNITFVKDISIISPEFSEVFRFRHYPTEDPNLVVVGDSCGQIDDVRNFREFYKTLLLTAYEGEVPEGEDPEKDGKLLLTFKVTTNGGNETEYSFYRYSTRRALVTVNGKGNFYVLVDAVQKIISDAQKVSVGESVDSYEKN